VRQVPLVPAVTEFERSVYTAFQIVQVPESGTTGQRPVIGLAVGQAYFDTTLGLPIWWDGGKWVDAVGGVPGAFTGRRPPP
jgi:hypothetical protein